MKRINIKKIINVSFIIMWLILFIDTFPLQEYEWGWYNIKSIILMQITLMYLSYTNLLEINKLKRGN